MNPKTGIISWFNFVELKGDSNHEDNQWFYGESCNSIPEEVEHIESEVGIEFMWIQTKKVTSSKTKINKLPDFKPNQNDFGFK